MGVARSALSGTDSARREPDRLRLGLGLPAGARVLELPPGPPDRFVNTPDRSLDGLVVSGRLGDATDPRSAFREWRRALRAGGRVRFRVSGPRLRARTARDLAETGFVVESVRAEAPSGPFSTLVCVATRTAIARCPPSRRIET